MQAEGSAKAIHVVRICQPPMDKLIWQGAGEVNFSGAAFAEWRQDESEAEQRKLEQEVAAALTDKQSDLTIEAIFQSDIVKSIIEAADHNHVDLIVMGSRGLGSLRGVLGSVSYGVLRASKLPVLIYK
jgi:nucleotide-binding universal stress UspA family protein